MSNNDLWMRDTIASYGLIVIIMLCIVIWFIQRWPTLRQETYKAHLLGFEMECAELIGPYKQHLFKTLHHTISNDEILRSMGSIRVLEIGIKTGVNRTCGESGSVMNTERKTIFCAPKTLRILFQLLIILQIVLLIGVDWNIKLGEYLVQGNRSWQFSHVIIERLIMGDGSSLKDVSTGCVDVVVTTRSLCSVRSVQSTLQEIRRVLAPGGKYIFVEHVIEKDIFARWLQIVLTRTGIWPSLFGGCRLDTDCIMEIGNAGFKKISWSFLSLEGYTSHPLHLFLSRQHVFGIATR